VDNLQVLFLSESVDPDLNSIPYGKFVTVGLVESHRATLNDITKNANGLFTTNVIVRATFFLEAFQDLLSNDT
jgi:hypothetical protein